MIIRNVLLLIISLQSIDLLSSSLMSIIKKDENKKLSPRKVCFSLLQEEDHFVLQNDQSDTTAIIKRYNQAKHYAKYCSDIAREDIVECCCFDCGQATRFCLLGCLIFTLGYSYGTESCLSFCGQERVFNCSKMK